MHPLVYSQEQLCEGIRRTLGPYDRYHLSTQTSLESCLMALDLDTPSMDRGALSPEQDGCRLWEWRDRLLDFPAPSVAAADIDAPGFAVWGGCVFVQWMTGHALAQDSVLCAVPLAASSTSRLGCLEPVVRAFWFLINTVNDLIVAADFDKDENVVSRAFYGTKFGHQRRPCATGIEWLDDWQRVFSSAASAADSGNTDSIGNNVQHLPAIPCPKEGDMFVLHRIEGVIEPLLRNTYGIGCPRHAKSPLLNLVLANELVEKMNLQLSSFYAAKQSLCHSTFSSLSQVATLLDSMSPAFQIIRALAVRFLFPPRKQQQQQQQQSSSFLAGIGSSGRLYPFSAAGSLWGRAGGKLVSSAECHHSVALFRCVLHAPSRVHRLLPDWLRGVAADGAGRPDAGPLPASDNFRLLVVWAKSRWVALGMELGLVSREGWEGEEAAEWLIELNAQPFGPHKPQHEKAVYSRRYAHRWRPLLQH